MNIAFIGLGKMGLPMAQNLVRKGHTVTGFDLADINMDSLVAIGGKKAFSISSATAKAEVVITMLPTSHDVESVYLGEHGVLSTVTKKPLLIDCSTISPETTRKVADFSHHHGLVMLDAPVSGGTEGAQAGTLTFMVGGDYKAVEYAKPLLENMGQNIFHAGPCGSGQIVKICNNMLLGIIMIGTSEALNLGIANGLNAHVLSEIMMKSSSRNWVLEAYNPCPNIMKNVPSSHEYSGGFGVDLMLKDLGLAIECALNKGSSVPLGALARNLYDLHSKAGHGQLDFSSIYKLLIR